MLLNCVLEKTLESLLDCKEIQPIHSMRLVLAVHWKNNDEAEAPIVWPPHGRTDCLEKTLMLGKIEGRRTRGQQRMKWLDGITDSMDVFEPAPGDGEGQGSLVCCGP